MVDRSTTAGLLRSSVARSPTVIHAENTSNGYSYGNPPTPGSHGGWFSGLRQKISQLTGMSEWLSQLGIGSERDGTMRSGPGMSHSAIVAPSTSNNTSTLLRSHSLIPGDYDDGTGFSFHSISLEDCPMEGDTMDRGWMDFSPHSWSDTLEKQHFGPLKNLLTIGGNRKGQGHDFQLLSIVQPTWCDKCGDFILFGFDKQSVKCKNCNYTCHGQCRPLVTLDCRSTSSTCSSDELPSLYPPLDDGTLGTIPKGTLFPDLPEVPQYPGKTTDSDKENGCFKNPLFVSPSATTPRNFSPFTPGTLNNKNPFRVEEVYVKEDTPFEFPPNMREHRLQEAIDNYNDQADGLGMKMGEDGESFTGYVHIHMNFTRPINVVAGEQPPTMYDVVNTGARFQTIYHSNTVNDLFQSK